MPQSLKPCCHLILHTNVLHSLHFTTLFPAALSFIVTCFIADIPRTTTVTTIAPTVALNTVPVAIAKYNNKGAYKISTLNAINRTTHIYNTHTQLNT